MGIDQIIFVLLIPLAVWSVFARNLKHAIISSGVFGLWAALAYLLYHAPDVAVSEAVVASALGTLLLVLTIRNYRDLRIEHVGGHLWHRRGALLVTIIGAGLALFLTARTPHIDMSPLHEVVMTTFLDSGTVVNPVTSILLGYRVFDTVFEALMLLVAVLGVVHLIEPRPREEARGFAGIAAGHPTMVTAVKVLTPVLIVVAAALIIGDPNTPGGGFQGAGLLAAVVVSRYLIRPVARSRAHNMETLEKVIYAVFVVSVALYLFVGLRHDIPFYTYTWFMLLMNGLLGLKVFCGLTIMFLYFTGEDDSEETAAVANATHTPEVPPHG